MAEGQAPSDIETHRPIRFDFPIGDKKINILEALLNKELRIPLSVDTMKPGDDAAQHLLRTFENMQVTHNEYLGCMPRLLENAAKPEGGFDSDYIAVFQHLLGKTQEKMGSLHSTELSREKRMIFFSRVNGQMEAIKNYIWTDPNMAEKKRQIVSKAKASLPGDTFK